MKKFFVLFVLISIFLLPPSFAHADFSCQPIYGGGQTCTSSDNISINKTVQNPQTGKMVDSLGITDPKFSPDAVVTFQISVTNTSKSTIKHIDVTDTFPQHTAFNTGTVNSASFTFGIDNLKPDETRVFTLVGKVNDVDSLPSQQIICVVNQATAKTDQGATSQDNSQFCIDKKFVSTPSVGTKGGFPVLPAAPIIVSPSTGAESLVLFSLIPTGIAGWFLKEYAILNGKEKN